MYESTNEGKDVACEEDMKLLIITQKVDESDSNLGFFIGWIKEFAARCENVLVICLEKGDYRLPENVRVLSLGKERLKILSRDGFFSVGEDLRFKAGRRFLYGIRFLKYIWRERKNYDSIFVHMNPEYMILGGFLWKLLGKKAALWYVHKEASWRLWFAEKLADKIFTASKGSCRLLGSKVEVVGHGIDINMGCLPARALRAGGQAGEQGTKLRKETETKKLRLITVGRISPVKDLGTLIWGFLELKKRFPEAAFSIIGEPITEKDRVYLVELRRLSSQVRFRGGIPHEELPRFLGEAIAFVHASRTGSIDKAVLEALAAGLPVFSSSDAFTDEIPGITKFESGNPADLAERITRAFESGRMVISDAGSAYVKTHHSLNMLIKRIIAFYE